LYLAIRPLFQPIEFHLKTAENHEERMICPWVELEKDQYKRLKELEENTGKRVSRMIREAVTSFVTKKDYSISIGASHLPREARENYRRLDFDSQSQKMGIMIAETRIKWGLSF